MSRNLDSFKCSFCAEPPVLEETGRPITEKEAGRYYHEFHGMFVANARCSYCEARYLAWNVTGKPGGTNGYTDLSFRSTFADEPGPADVPHSYSGVVSAVRVETVGGHDRIRIWNRGGFAGELVVRAGDGPRIVAHLAPWLVPR